MAVDIGAAVPWTRWSVCCPRATTVVMNGRRHGLRVMGLQRMGVAQEGEGEENEREHAEHCHQAMPDGSETVGIYTKRRKLDRHFLVLQHLWQGFTTSHPAYH